MIDEATISKAVGTLQQAAPKATVILFGSFAAGTANDKSDVDLLVVEPELGSRREETARLKRALKPLGIPVDVIVISQKTYTAWTQIPKAITQLTQQPNRSYPAITFGTRIWTLFAGQPAASKPA
jgi:uncharacterized protein